MARPKVRGELKRQNLNIDAELFDKLSEMSLSTGIPKTRLLEDMIREEYDEFKKKDSK